MASFQAHLVSWIVKRRIKPRLAGERDVNRIRQILKPLPFRVPKDIRVTPAQLGGIAGEWVESPQGRAPLLYVHGGGYFACSPQTHRAITCAFAKLGFRVFTPAYRLAPEHPFPAAIEDMVCAYETMVDQFGSPFPVAGESAGGGLALAMMLLLRAKGKELPRSAALFSPWTDLAGTGDSVQTNHHRCAMFSAPDVAAGAQIYLQGADPRNPLASPLYADLSNLPPLLIHVGANEILLDDSVRLAARAQDFGVPVILKIFPVVSHAWQMAYPHIPEARTSLREAAEFLHAH
jgi:acetyl esterase/lipase